MGFYNFTQRDDPALDGGAGGPPVDGQTPTFSAGSWANQGDAKDANGNPIAGTNGMQQDVNRDQAMGADTGAAPVINQSESNASRGISMGALGLLGARANGGMTPAQAMAARQTTGAVQGVQSGAASIKGGASNRAAAARMAGQQTGNIQAQGDQNQAAIRAGEMADASNQYLGAAGAQRQNDMGLAKSQADLQAQQNQLNNNRQNFYEDQALKTKEAQMANVEGMSEDQIKQRQVDLANKHDANATALWAANTTVGGVSGIAGAGGASGGGGQGDPYSDERTKEGVRDMTLSPAEAKDNIRPLTGNENGPPRAIGRMNSRVKRITTPGYDRSIFKRDDSTDKLNAALEKRIQDDRDGERGSLHEPTPVEKGSTGAPLGLAAARFGKPGAVGGPDTGRGYDLGTGYSVDPTHDPWAKKDGPSAPGTEDDRGGGEVTDAKSRQIMGLEPLPTPMRTEPAKGSSIWQRFGSLSDGKTKQNAKPVETPEAKKAREDAEDEKTTREFMGDKYVPKGTPEEEAQKAREELNKAAYEARERVRQNEIEAKKTDEHAASEWLSTRENASARKYRESPVAPFVPGFVDRYVEKKQNERKALPESERAVIARKQLAEEQAAAARKQEQHDQTENLTPNFLRRITDRALEMSGLRKAVADDKARDATLSPVEAKQDIAPVDPKNGWLAGSPDNAVGMDYLYAPDGAELHADKLLAHREEQGTHDIKASLSGRTPHFTVGTGEHGNAGYGDGEETGGNDTKTKPEARIPRAKPAAQKMSPAKLEAWAKAQLAGIQAQNEASQAQGPSVGAAIERANQAPELAADNGPARPALMGADEAYSDEKTKKGAHPEGPMAAANLAMHPFEYEYKEGFRELEHQKPGEKNVGPMAQEMDKDPVARTALIKDPGTGLMAIDKSKGLKLVMGGLSDLQRQVDDMKRRKA